MDLLKNVRKNMMNKMNNLKLKEQFYKGKLIVFEGTDGAGKTTLVSMTRQLLESYGKVVTKTTTYYEKASTTSIVQQQTLDSTGNYVKYVYDERGNGIKMQYDYQDSTGLLLSSITPEQQKTEYTYNEKEELDNMRATVGNRINENAYVYQREYPVRVSHNGVNFDFVYDAKGITKIEIAGANLLRSYHEKLVDYDTTGQRCEVISFVTKNGLYTVRSVYNKNGLLTHKQKYVSSAALESHLNDAVSSSAWSNLPLSLIS